jgi:hypothetical protein
MDQEYMSNLFKSIKFNRPQTEEMKALDEKIKKFTERKDELLEEMYKGRHYSQNQSMNSNLYEKYFKEIEELKKQKKELENLSRTVKIAETVEKMFMPEP